MGELGSGVDCRRRILRHVKTDNCTKKNRIFRKQATCQPANFSFSALSLHFQRNKNIKKIQKQHASLHFIFPVSAHTFVISPSKFAWISTEIYIQFYFPRAFFLHRNVSPDRRAVPSPQSTS